MWPLCVPAQSFRAFMSSIIDHAMTQRGDGVRTHEKLLSWISLRHLDPQDRTPFPLSTIAILAPAPANKCTPPPQRIIAERFSAMAPGVSNWTHTPFPELRADRPYH